MAADDSTHRSPDIAAEDHRSAGAPWHHLDADEVVVALATDRQRGLSREAAAERLARFGTNELETDEGRGLWRTVLAQFTSPLIAILLVAFAVTLLLDEYIDAAVIAAVLILNAAIGALQEHKADRSVRALMQLAAPHCTVIRDGREHDLPATQLVPGDLIVLASGARLPADARLVRAAALEVDESLFTGESEAVRKSVEPVAEETLVADRTCMVHMGSSVVRGRATAVVVATGARTQLGGIADSIRENARPVTPLQQRMDRFAKIVAAAVLASTAVAFGLGIALGGDVSDMFLTAVALAVAVVPEGLPIALTVALALGVRRMAQRNAIVRSLPAVETLGSTDVIGSDKTGTLTANRMTAVAVWTADLTLDVAASHTARSADSAAKPRSARRQDALSPSVEELLNSAVAANEAVFEVDDAGVPTMRGDATETALIALAFTLGYDAQAVRAREIFANVPFESERQYSLTVLDESGPVVRVKGAPERVVAMCTSMQEGEQVVALEVERVMAAAEQMAGRGLRVLATAHRRLSTSHDATGQPPVDDLVFGGLIGLHDPPREGVEEAIARCRHAGIRVVMITGDHASTAQSIATQLGIAESDAQVLTGHDLQDCSDDELFGLVTSIDVYARVTPEHKLRVVTALRRHGHVVAVTGDGVNDGPALKAADIGVAMGRSGTDVAREASDIVLTDDNFVSIANAVEEGRVVFDNVRKVTYFLLSTGAAAIVAILTAIAVGLPLPYTPAALLWLNVVTNGLQDVALAFEPAEPDVLERRPRRRDEGILNRVLWERVVLTGIVMAVGSLWVFHWATSKGLSPDQQRGVALTALVIAMAVHVYTARSEQRSVLRTGIFGNPLLLSASVIAVSVHFAATLWSPTQRVLQIAPVTAGGWVRISLIALAVVATSELHKLLRKDRSLGEISASRA